MLEPGDTIIDGGNSRYHDDIRRAGVLAERGIHYVDVGTSGGVFGLARGFCLMIGGDEGGGRRAWHRSSTRSHPASTPPRGHRVARESLRRRSSAGSTAALPAPGTS